jgi:probable O-glycosylation ligase (exosortase A-associated)
MGRVVVWKLSTLIALDHPLLGGGLHAVQSQNIWNAYVPGFAKLSFIPTVEPDVRPHAAHSIYFEVLGDTGVAGLLVFLGIVGSCVLTSFQIKAAARGRPDLRWAASLSDMLRLSLLMFLVAGAALSAAYHDLVFIVFALFSAVRGAVAAEPNFQAHAAAVPQPTGWRARRLNEAIPAWRRLSPAVQE